MSSNPTDHDGVLGQVQQIYDKTLRQHLPKTLGELAGVTARHPRIFDITKNNPHYKEGLVQAAHDVIEPGMVVDEIGTGRGVLTTHCLKAGADRVRGYEAADDMLKIANNTLARNVGSDWSSRVDLHHAVVGEPSHVYGTAAENVVAPSTLSDADVLLMDVEGAEQPILRQLETAPAIVIVETHPERGAPADETLELLEAAGYDEVDRRQYEPGVDINEKPVLVGHRDDRTNRNETRTDH